MKKHMAEFDSRNTKIHKEIYKHSFSLTGLLRSLASVILIGQSQAGNPDYHYLRRHR